MKGCSHADIFSRTLAITKLHLVLIVVLIVAACFSISASADSNCNEPISLQVIPNVSAGANGSMSYNPKGQWAGYIGCQEFAQNHNYTDTGTSTFVECVANEGNSDPAFDCTTANETLIAAVHGITEQSVLTIGALWEGGHYECVNITVSKISCVSP